MAKEYKPLKIKSPIIFLDKDGNNIGRIRSQIIFVDKIDPFTGEPLRGHLRDGREVYYDGERWFYKAQ